METMISASFRLPGWMSLRFLAVFKVIVLWRQSELSGPLRYTSIAITSSHDFSHDFRAIEQAKMENSRSFLFFLLFSHPRWGMLLAETGFWIHWGVRRLRGCEWLPGCAPNKYTKVAECITVSRKNVGESTPWIPVSCCFKSKGTHRRIRDLHEPILSWDFEPILYVSYFFENFHFYFQKLAGYFLTPIS